MKDNKINLKVLKSNKGITLTSLIIYIIGMTIIVGIVATLTTVLQNNVNEVEKNSQDIAQILNFNMYFLEDVKKENNKIVKIEDNLQQITFLTGNTYTFSGDAIYYNNVKICENIKNVKFELVPESNNIKVLIQTNSSPAFEKTIEYTVK